MILARVASAVAHMLALSAASSSTQRGTGSGNGRPKISPKYQASEVVRCLTRPRRLVPVGVSGRRTSYSDSPSSFHSSASRIQRRSPCRYSFAISSIMGQLPRGQASGAEEPEGDHGDDDEQA